jgi:hypothetical protein
MRTIAQEEGMPVALLETHLALIHGSVGSDLFRHLYTDFDGQFAVDVLLDGDIACVFYVSSILTLSGMTEGGVHSTMTVMLEDLKRSGWQVIDDPCPGCVVVWGEKLSDSDRHVHRHIGFYVGDDTAVSMHPRHKSPQYHPYGCRPIDEGRKTVEAFYWKDFDIYRDEPAVGNELQTFRGDFSTPPPEHRIPKLG